MDSYTRGSQFVRLPTGEAQTKFWFDGGFEMPPASDGCQKCFDAAV
jgi:hypothetical protein